MSRIESCKPSYPQVINICKVQELPYLCNFFVLDQHGSQLSIEFKENFSLSKFGQLVALGKWFDVQSFSLLNVDLNQKKRNIQSTSTHEEILK